LKRTRKNLKKTKRLQQLKKTFLTLKKTNFMLSLNNESTTMVMLRINGLFQAIKNAFVSGK